MNTPNNFNLMRLLAAIAVMLQHSVYLATGKDTFGIGFIGVLVFFLISGYLITNSWMRNNDAIRFLKNRILRIFPALIVAILFVMFVIGPLLTTLPLSQYLNQVKIPFPPLGPDFLPQTFNQTTVLGQLWTIPFELVGYALIMALGLFDGLKKEIVFGFVLIIAFQAIWVLMSAPQSAGPFFVTMAMFFLGSAYYFFKDDIKLNNLIAFAVFCLWMVTMLFLNWRLQEISEMIAVPYLAFWFVFLDVQPLYNAVSRIDLSYAIYLYGYAIQQTIVPVFSGISAGPLFIFSMLVTIPIAWLSWTFIEKPMLALKTR